jgi:hypothetical protein
MKDRARRCLILVGALCAISGRATGQEAEPAQDSREAGANTKDGRLAVSGKYGSIGPGVDLTYGWSRDLHARLSLSYDPDEKRTEKDAITAAGSLLLDWHPGGGAFRLSGGLALIHTETEIAGLSSTGKSSGSNSLTSYFGVGWGNPLRRGSRWSFLVDVGVFGGGGLSYNTAPDATRASTSEMREAGSSGLRLHFSWHAAVSTGVSFRF